ncbi:hypothetical protein Acr_12g0006340 [Actinidia rufa]|uniref:TauD/TfdA-like domain-containing protein n=1 Tax=Actinidia rufa TaxID=165716 RepID=A0A7J0FHN1_9ERIC|nr:hypothetical protein Acr_12g0006340 [Actinidia rufa]
MEFVEGKIAEEKVLGGGLVFPKTLIPPPAPSNSSKVRSLVEMIMERREWLSEVLDRHSAILFRGFGVASPEEFGQVVEAFGWEEMPYVGAISRTKMAQRVYTASEAPVLHPIAFHHEMSTVRNHHFFFLLHGSVFHASFDRWVVLWVPNFGIPNVHQEERDTRGVDSTHPGVSCIQVCI